MRDLTALFEAIDEANAEDPNIVDDQPLAQLQGRAASRWLPQLASDPSDELQLAVRAHHLRRWELARTDFDEGRAGYLQWRRSNKAHQAASLGELMSANDWPADSIERARALLERTQLRTDQETQTLEDAACLVFLETQFDEMTTRLAHDHLVSVVQKTLKKMSPDAVGLAGSIPLSEAATRVLSEAVNPDSPKDA